MTTVIVLLVIGILQGVFLVLLAIFLGVRREVARVRRSAFVVTRNSLSAPLSEWIAGAGGVAPFVEALRQLPHRAALTVTGNLARTTIPPTERDVLAVALRNEGWVQRALSRANSRHWGQRLEAARALGLVGTPADRSQLEAMWTAGRAPWKTWS